VVRAVSNSGISLLLLGLVVKFPFASVLVCIVVTLTVDPAGGSGTGCFSEYGIT
jgi:hypothetical protein